MHGQFNGLKLGFAFGIDSQRSDYSFRDLPVCSKIDLTSHGGIYFKTNANGQFSVCFAFHLPGHGQYQKRSIIQYKSLNKCPWPVAIHLTEHSC